MKKRKDHISSTIFLSPEYYEKLRILAAKGGAKTSHIALLETIIKRYIDANYDKIAGI